ncbi:uncharacterized protein DMENIID0001_023280 [Sergentomyia squamirostris]
MLLFEENQIGSSTMTSNANHEDRDEVDFVVQSSYARKSPDLISHTNGVPPVPKESTETEEKKPQNEKSIVQTKTKGRRDSGCPMMISQAIKQDVKPKLNKGTMSIARLLGNTYNTATGTAKTHSTLKRSQLSGKPAKIERFNKNAELCDVDESKSDSVISLPQKDTNPSAFRAFTRSLRKLLRRTTNSVNISSPDPEYKVSYLGNVLTGWAKGDGCVEKPMSTLWRNYVQHSKPDVLMKIKVTSSGLKASTKAHGLTEYWSNRITHCAAPENFPKVFCWIYRHEGRKLKHELRCHAVLCSKESIARNISVTLQNNLFKALKEFRQDKISRQNSRLSLTKSMPQRKLLLSVGGNNYKPPLERSKSAPKLMVIEEEEENETEESAEARACCREDSLYPSMTLGKRKCRKGHSIRRTGNKDEKASKDQEKAEKKSKKKMEKKKKGSDTKNSFNTPTNSDEEIGSLLGSEPLIGELMPLFEMKLHPPMTQSMSDLLDTDKVEEAPPASQLNRSLDALDKFSDYEDDTAFFNQNDILAALRRESATKRCTSPENHPISDLYGALRQSPESILIINDSIDSRKLTPVAAGESEESHQAVKPENRVPDSPPAMLRLPHGLVLMDSDEGSISSGCETASTVTANTEEMNIKPTTPDDDVVILEPVGEKESMRSNHHFLRSVTFPPDIKALDHVDSDSEFSDESGFSELQESSLKSRNKAIMT